jgi:multiple sugar transport system permease protein
MLNATLENLGLGDLAKPWLASEQTALASIIVVGLWQGIGFTAILFSARLESISSELYEAARLDGASDWRVMWGIAFPISYAYVGTLAMLQYIWMLFASAGLILLLTRGGPGTASTTLSLMVYKKAFLENELGYSQAIGVVLFFAGLVGMLVIRRVFREKT